MKEIILVSTVIVLFAGEHRGKKYDKFKITADKMCPRTAENKNIKSGIIWVGAVSNPSLSPWSLTLVPNPNRIL